MFYAPPDHVALWNFNDSLYSDFIGAYDTPEGRPSAPVAGD